MDDYLAFHGRTRTALHVAAWVAVVALSSGVSPAAMQAQTFHSDDPVIRSMWEAGMENSQTEALAQVLMDSIGPRLAGSQELILAQDWLVELYRSWGVTVRKEEYGTWNGWRQGYLHVDLVAPRVQTLEAEFLAWSAGTPRTSTPGTRRPAPPITEPARS